MQHTEIKLNSKEIFKGNVFRVTMDQVELENGMTSFREVVHHNGGACILPLTDDDKVLMVRQYRYALKEELWELPGGKSRSAMGRRKSRILYSAGLLALTF